MSQSVRFQSGSAELQGLSYVSTRNHTDPHPSIVSEIFKFQMQKVCFIVACIQQSTVTNTDFQIFPQTCIAYAKKRSGLNI